jgi:phosphoadenosine phosphosulfate reductase
MTSTQILELTPDPRPVLDPALEAKLAHVRALLIRELATAPGDVDACLTCSFQAEDILLLHLTRELRPNIPVLFLDTGYHFAETYAYRDRMAAEWNLNLTTLLTCPHRRRTGARARPASPDRAGSLLCSP